MRPVCHLLLWASLTTACAATSVRSGKPPGLPANGYDHRWHPAFVFGAVSFRDEYDLSRICPSGWAEIRLEPDPFTALAGLVTLFMYSPSRLTIVCATDSIAPPPLPTYLAPGPTRQTAKRH